MKRRGGIEGLSFFFFFGLHTDGSSTHGMEGLLGYSSLPRQQLLALDPNIYGGEPFRHGLTPPQLANEQLHPYGKRSSEE